MNSKRGLLDPRDLEIDIEEASENVMNLSEGAKNTLFEKNYNREHVIKKQKTHSPSIEVELVKQDSIDDRTRYQGDDERILQGAPINAVSESFFTDKDLVEEKIQSAPFDTHSERSHDFEISLDDIGIDPSRLKVTRKFTWGKNLNDMTNVVLSRSYRERQATHELVVQAGFDKIGNKES